MLGLAALAWLLACVGGAGAQGASKQGAAQWQTGAGQGTAGQAASEEIEFNPLKAERNLQVGKYYLKKGNYDAAIDRLKDALKYKSNFAEPHLLLGEAYEKKGERQEALREYRKYLEILPSAEDAGKVRKRIEKLEENLTGKAKKAP